MNTSKAKKSCMTLGVIALTLFLSASAAFPWGWATHAYINDQLYDRPGSKMGVFRSNEIYGGIGPDFVNDLFQFPYERGYLADRTHIDPVKVWDVAKSRPAKALARGFASHSEKAGGLEFGADSSAHIAGLTTSGGAAYIIEKAEILAAVLGPELSTAGLTLPHDVVVEISHEIVESALDIALAQYVDHSIGQKMIDAAIRRSGMLSQLLTRAYGKDFSVAFNLTDQEAASFIRNGERKFRESVVFYGYALNQDVYTAVELLSEQKADVAENYLKLIAPGLTVDRATILDLARGGIWLSLLNTSVVDVPEFMNEISLTIDFVEANLLTEEIDY
jgi:hypothetical protein